MFEQRTLFENDELQPLAARLRPQTLEEFCGQKHLLGEGKVLRRLIESDKVGSMIFWGPPGVGKTTLARIIANRTKADFIDFSAVTSGIKEIKQVMEQAEKSRQFGGKTILFVDEIHRFNKAQQDAFLPFVEKGSIILIGATTENPSFEVNSALLSRCKVFVLQALKTEELTSLLNRAVTEERGFGKQRVEISNELLEVIANFANGDARSALSTLEMAVLNGELMPDGTTVVTKETIEQCTSKKSLLYDKTGEEHYNLSSALHKSMKGFVLDHIKAGKSLELYEHLQLDKLDCTVAIIKNARSDKMGKKDILKVECDIDMLNLDVLAFIDHSITVNVIKNGDIVEKKVLVLPQQIKIVIKCHNPRCITSIEQELPHIFYLADPESEVYRCKYCEEKYSATAKVR